MDSVNDREAILRGWFETARLLGALDVWAKYGITPANVAELKERLEHAHALIGDGLHGTVA